MPPVSASMWCFVPCTNPFPFPRRPGHGRHLCARPLPVRVCRKRLLIRADADSTAPIPLSPPAPVVPVTVPGAPLSATTAPRPWRESASRDLLTLWRFSRPHTIWGTLVSVVCMHTLAWLSGGWAGAAPALSTLLVALVPALLLNVFIVGLNQYFDVAIDAINKPDLPLAAGTLSPARARAVIWVCLAAGLSFCLAPGATPALRAVLCGSAGLGAAYSAPPVRLKRHPLLASACILGVRGVLINGCFFLHAMRAGAVAALTPLVRFCICFFVCFGVVIAFLKDVPDIVGDRVYGVRTLSVRLGPAAVFRACVALLAAMFLAAAAFFAATGSTPLAAPAAAAHVVVAAALVWRARAVDPADKHQAYRYYMLTWGAFYLEYFLLPFGV